jgi:lipopolysaccharide biosynthesis protein
MKVIDQRLPPMSTFESNIKHMVQVDASIRLLDAAKLSARCFLKSVPTPEFRVINDDFSQSKRWAVYFCFNPNGKLLPQNEFMITALKKDGFKVLLVIACRDHAAIDPRFIQLADVVLWKDMKGFDMSALRLGLTYVCQTRGDVSVLWINDSVFGPFKPIHKFLSSCGDDFDVLGMTLSYAIRPHFQSYCIFFRRLTPDLIKGMFGRTLKTTLNDHLSNVIAFEACFAANLTSAGFKVKCWAAPVLKSYDLTMAYPFELIEQGFPFLKRSLVGKFAAAFDQQKTELFLNQHRFVYQLA